MLSQSIAITGSLLIDNYLVTTILPHSEVRCDATRVFAFLGILVHEP